MNAPELPLVGALFVVIVPVLTVRMLWTRQTVPCIPGAVLTAIDKKVRCRMTEPIRWYHADLPLDVRIKGWSDAYETGRMTGGAVLGLCADAIAQRNDYHTALISILKWARDSHCWTFENRNPELFDALADAGFELDAYDHLVIHGERVRE